MQNCNTKLKYASPEWVEKVLNDGSLTLEDHHRIASDLARCGHLKALCLLHIGLCRKMRYDNLLD